MADRRIERTLESIYRNFMYLLLEKEVKDISVKKLCEKANINKSTFYLHFHDIFDCHIKCMQKINQVILETAKLYSFDALFQEPEKYLCVVLDFLEEDLHFYRQLAASPHFPGLMATFKEWMIRTELELYGVTPETNWDTYATIVFLIEGTTGLIFRSISFYNREKLTKQLAELILKCSPAGFLGNH